MTPRVSRKRLEMGEAAWIKYQTERKKEKAKRWAKNNKEKLRENQKIHDFRASCWRVRLKKELIEYKGGKCIICGYNKDCQSAYDFHHRDVAKKEFGISGYTILNREKLYKEVDKCDLLCCRCHAEIHDKERAEKREKIFEEYEKWENSRRKAIIITCSQCGREIITKRNNHKFCSEKCRNLFFRKVKERPSIEELESLIKNNTMVKIGEMFGVSNNAVKKWAKNYRLL